jgi:hypothetical protein
MCTFLPNPFTTTKIKALANRPYIPLTTNSMVLNSSKFSLYIKSKIECVGTKCKYIRKRSICSITIVSQTLNTNSQFPLSNLFLKMTSEFNTHSKDPTFKQREKVDTKLDPTIRIIV